MEDGPDFVADVSLSGLKQNSVDISNLEKENPNQSVSMELLNDMKPYCYEKKVWRNFENFAAELIKVSVEEALRNLPPRILITESNSIYQRSGQEHKYQESSFYEDPEEHIKNSDNDDKRVSEIYNENDSHYESLSLPITSETQNHFRIDQISGKDLKLLPESNEKIIDTALETKTNELTVKEENQELLIKDIQDECNAIRQIIDQRTENYKNSENIEEDSFLDFSNHVECLRQITNSTLDLTKDEDDLKSDLKINQNLTPKMKKKQLVKSPLTKRKEIKKLFQNHRECENSDILEEIFKPVTIFNQEEIVQTSITYQPYQKKQDEDSNQETKNVSELPRCHNGGCCLHDTNFNKVSGTFICKNHLSRKTIYRKGF